MIVDDELVDIIVMHQALESLGGYSVVEAISYLCAVRAFNDRNGDVDLLITDVCMPFRTGIDLARTLLEQKPTLKVLFTSGYVGAELLRAMSVPAAERYFIPKPFTVDTFLSRVRHALESPFETLSLSQLSSHA